MVEKRDPTAASHARTEESFTTRGGETVPLSPKEFAVLEVLMEADGGVISAEDLLAGSW